MLSTRSRITQTNRFILGVAFGIAMVISCNRGPSHVEAQNQCSGSCKVDGPIELKSPVIVQGASGPIPVQGSVGVNGPVAVQGSVGVNGPVTVQGSVGVTSPVAIQGPVDVRVAAPMQAITADTDTSRLVAGGGILTSASGPTVSLLVGPFVVTDVSNPTPDPLADQSFKIYSADNADCIRSYASGVFAIVKRDTPVHGARMFVPAGKHLCVAVPVPMYMEYSFSGFRPY